MMTNQIERQVQLAPEPQRVYPAARDGSVSFREIAYIAVNE